MADVEEAEIPQSPPTVLANTTVSQGEGGKLLVYVNGERMIGVTGAQITTEGVLVLAMPSYCFRLAGVSDSKAPIYETKDNVIGYPMMQAYREKWRQEQQQPTPDDTPPQTDGDSA